MKKSMKAGALLVAGIFALSGCGSSDDSASADSPASDSPSPAPTLAVGQEQYTAEELEAALTAVKADRGLTGEVSNDAALRPGLSESGAAPGGFNVAPEQCMEILGFANFFGDLDNANVAGLGASETQRITVVSHADAAALDQQVDDNSKLVDECAEFEMTGDGEGEVAKGTAERLDASTEAPSTQAFTVTMAAAGVSFSGMKVAAASGTTNVVITVSESEDPKAALASAEETINAVLAELAQ